MSILKDLLALNNTSARVSEAREEFDPDELENLADLLTEYHGKMVKIMGEVQDVVHMLPRSYRGSAESYWIPHIMIALGGEHKWMTAGHESTMQKMIDEMNEEAKAQQALNDAGPDREDFDDREY